MEKKYHSLLRALFFAAALLTLGGCSPLVKEQRARFFWPPPPNEPKIEYINYYFSDDDLKRGVDRRLESAFLGLKYPERLLVQPYSVASDGHGRVFVADGSGVVHIFDLSRHAYRQLAAAIAKPQKVLVDSVGEIWFLDSGRGILFHYGADEQRLAEFKLPGTTRASSFAVDRQRQRIYVVDTPQHQLHLYDLEGHFLETRGRRGIAPGEFNYPGDIDLDADGNLYMIDTMNARIQVLAPDGTVLRTMGERGTARGSFSTPKGIAVSPSGLIYISDATQHKIVIFNRDGDYLLTLGGGFVYTGENIAPGGFYFPAGLDVDARETLWVADLLNAMLHEFQYLTPEFLASHPIRDEEVYRPQGVDLQSRTGGVDLLPPVP